MPVFKPGIITLAVLPLIPPGLMVQFPAGKLLNKTLPVATVQVGCVIVPTTGDDGITAVITTPDEAGDVHPTELVTVKLYVPILKPVRIMLAVLPASAIGLIVQFPAGSPVISTLPVAVEQVGWVIAPGNGAAGVKGCGLMIIFPDSADVQPTELVTV